jgi:CRP-like cAMP-binding protein
MTTLASHPQRNSLRLQLRQNIVLQGMSPAQWAELERLLTIAEYRKGDPLVRQGDEEMEQLFILEGMLKRVVSNPQGREMILRFAAEAEMDTSYAAWRLRTRVPYSIVAVTKVRTAELAMPVWVEFLDRNPDVKSRFEYEVMKLMSEVMTHTITLHLLDAPGRLSRFQRKHPELAGRIPKKELAAYLNLTPETLSRLRQRLGEP